ncbi:GNAT family N-acetyltransferase [Nonomuraea jabiensis]|uniref:GNAT family N-acetyltransferase n=1 Tax=Nonomuraea jabiensis TaxID=882448 RepID=UPI003D75D26A
MDADPAHRGRGLATRLVLAVAAGIRRRDETPFLHASAANAGAIPSWGEPVPLTEAAGRDLGAVVERTSQVVPACLP